MFVSKLSWWGRPLVAAVILFSAADLTAQSLLTWNPAGPTNVWSTAAPNTNWTGGVVWPSIGASAIFGGTADSEITVGNTVNVFDITFGSSQVIGSSGAGTINLFTSTAGHKLTVTNAGDTAQIDETITGSSSIEKLGAGTLVITGASNSFGSSTKITEGMLRITTPSALVTSNSVSIGSSGTLDVAIGTASYTNPTSGTGTIRVTGSGNTSFTNNSLTVFQGTFDVSTTGSGKAILTQSIGSSGNIQVANGSTLQLGTASFGTDYFLPVSVQGTGNTENRGAIRIENGSRLLGTLTLLGSTTIGNSDNATTGTIAGKITGNFPLVTAANWGEVGQNPMFATINLTSPDSDYQSLTVSAPSSTIGVGADATVVSGVVTKGPLGLGTVTLSGGGLSNNTASIRTISNPIFVTGTNPSGIVASTAPLIVASNITGNGPLVLVGGDTSRPVRLAGDNSGYSGTVSNGGTTNTSAFLALQLDTTSAGSAAASWGIEHYLFLAFPGNATVSLGALSGGASGRIRSTVAGTKTVEVGALNTNTTYGGKFEIISGGSVILRKVGSGTLTLTASDYLTSAGTTIVDGGKLLVTGSQSFFSSPVIVNSGGTYGGSNLNNNSQPILINTGGTISPGSSIGRLNTGNQNWKSGIFFDFETRSDGTGTPGTNYDTLMISGVLDLTDVSTSDPVTINLFSMSSNTTAGLLATWNPNIDHRWPDLIQTFGITNFDPSKFEIDTSGFQNTINGSFSVVRDGVGLDLVYTAVPEPGVWVSILFCGIVLGIYRCGIQRNRYS